MDRDLALSRAERDALDALVPVDRQSGDVIADLIAAAHEALRRRERNTAEGGAVLAALYRDAQSWRTVGYLTGIPFATARRWAVPPLQADIDRPEPSDAPD